MPASPRTPSYKRTGERRHFVTLQSATVTRDRIRGRQEVWSAYGTEWAAITPQPLVLSEQQASVIYLVEIPFRSDVVVGHRVIEQRVDTSTRTLKVIAVADPEESHRALQLYCAEVIVPVAA